ncbi:MAG: hypothetical protein JWL73_1407 [Actinomycetia bacterium]|nr:hypothetical protein [Actinomycetes bacterium]
MDVSERFAELVTRPEPEIRLDEGAFLIAAHARPGLDVSAECTRLDGVAADVARAGASDFAGLARGLFGGPSPYVGNTDDYGDPANSYLDAVLDRRLGIPITLSVLMVEVGRRIDVPVVGVGMPGHFLARDARDPASFCDPFDGGALLDPEGCAARFAEVTGGRTPFDPGFLDPVGPRAILSRMLANLEQTFLVRERRHAVWAARLELSVPGLAPGRRRTLAMLLGTLGRHTEAAAELEALATSGHPAGGPELQRLATGLRARSN